jgi:6-phosphogluconate dehydrogenase
MSGERQADVGLIGLAVMGRNLALNIADHGFAIAVYNRTTSVMREFVSECDQTPGDLIGCETLEDLLGALKTPRIILLMVQAGTAVDAVVEQLLKAGLQAEDLVVDCGNSRWTDTMRREEAYADRCKFFVSG